MVDLHLFLLVPNFKWYSYMKLKKMSLTNLIVSFFLSDADTAFFYFIQLKT